MLCNLEVNNENARFWENISSYITMEVVNVPVTYIDFLSLQPVVICKLLVSIETKTKNFENMRFPHRYIMPGARGHLEKQP